jgi:hypothetical protein
MKHKNFLYLKINKIRCLLDKATLFSDDKSNVGSNVAEKPQN